MKGRSALYVFSLTHLVVDFACFFVLMGAFFTDVGDLTLITLGFFTYNAIAFALQLPIGYLVDIICGKPSVSQGFALRPPALRGRILRLPALRCRISHVHFAAFGCFLVILGVICPMFPWLRLTSCALGNALFHIGGGIDSLISANGRYARSGIFISFGAIGVALGTLLGREDLIPPLFVVLLLACCAILILRFCLQPKNPLQSAVPSSAPPSSAPPSSAPPSTPSPNVSFSSAPPSNTPLSSLHHAPYHTTYRTTFSIKSTKIKASGAVILLCVIAIIIRAVVGAYTPVPWKEASAFLFVLPALAVFAGKFAGGILADCLGARLVVTASLLISAPLLAFGNSQITFCCAGLFLFNISTAATLCVISSRLPKNPGFSFGLTTLALFLGTSVSFFWSLPDFLRPVLSLLLIAAAAFCIYLATPDSSGKNC